MTSLCDTFETLLNAGVLRCHSSVKNTKLQFNMLLSIEQHLEEYEKVSLSFLFFEDIATCFNICEKCINVPLYCFLSENSIIKDTNWNEKLLECIFHAKHILLLKKLGIGKYDAERYFKTPKFVSKQRLLYYKICESLSIQEAADVMKSDPSLSPEKYTEMYILKVLSSKTYLDSFLKFLSSLNNAVINSFLKELSSDILIRQNYSVPVVEHLLPKSMDVNQDEIYPIKDAKNVGLCLIINEVNFKTLDNRKGSMADVSLLESTMKYLKFDVKTFPDVPKKFFENDLCRNIEKYFKYNHSVFILVILSHGKQGAVYCSDEKAITIDFITTKLTCKILYKIPKVLIVQACQGDKLLLKDLATDGPGDTLECDQSTPKPHNIVKYGNYISDFLLVMSTVSGFKAIRDMIQGTWFIQTLCESLKENENACIFSIITQTIKKVKGHSIHTKYNFEFGQQPEMRSLLEKKLYLKPLI